MSIRDALDALPQATHGPWDAVHVNDKGLWCICKAENGVVISPSTDNARLIAAAPEMAKWIMEAVPWLSELMYRLMSAGSAGSVEYSQEIDQLKALIAEAVDSL